MRRCYLILICCGIISMCLFFAIRCLQIHVQLDSEKRQIDFCWVVRFSGDYFVAKDRNNYTTKNVPIIYYPPRQYYPCWLNNFYPAPDPIHLNELQKNYYICFILLICMMLLFTSCIFFALSY